MRQKSFRLVIGRVRDGHGRRSPGRAFAFEERIAQASRGVFQIPTVALGFAGDIRALADELKPGIAGELRNESRVGIGFRSAQRVIEMQNEKCNAKLAAQVFQQPQERHRIGPA